MSVKLAKFYRDILSWRSQCIDELSASAIIFSPHPDDETLGCGGTIIKKLMAGASLQVVQMTDGRNSHRRLMEGEKLKSMRAQEVKEAMRVLGLPEDKLCLLEYEDGHLADSAEDAVTVVTGLLREIQPKEVFIPTRWELPHDHYATYAIVREAIRKAGVSIVVNEYPIWFWANRPFVSPEANGIGGRLSAQWQSLLANYRMLKNFNHKVIIDDVVQQKRLALECHRSQMTQVMGGEAWKRLQDVYDGLWLDCFFGQWELFYRYRC